MKKNHKLPLDTRGRSTLIYTLQELPELEDSEIEDAIQHVRNLFEAFQIPVKGNLFRSLKAALDKKEKERIHSIMTELIHLVRTTVAA